MADGITPNAKLAVIEPTRRNWAAAMNTNMQLLDAIVGTYFIINSLQGEWQNSTVYGVSDTIVDPVTSTVWQCQVAHTSSQIPTTFLQERTANPTYWTVYSSPARARGAWEPNTNYATNDFVVSGSKYAIANTTHTSSGNFDADVIAGRWSILVDLSAAGSQVLPILVGIPDANKIVVTTPSGSGYTIADAAATLALMGITSIGQALFLAVSQSAARAAITAQESSATLDSIVSNGVTPFGLSWMILADEAAARDVLDVPVSILNYGTDGTALYTALLTGRRVRIPASITSLTLSTTQFTTFLARLQQLEPEALTTFNIPATINLTLLERTITTINAGNPFGDNIIVSGATPLTKSITSAPTVSTVSAGAHQVNFPVADSSQFVLNEFVIVKSVIGTGNVKVLEGVHEVIAIPSGTSVRLRVKARKATMPSLAGFVSGSILVMQTSLHINSSTGLSVTDRGGIFRNMVLVGNNTGSNNWGVYVNYAGSVKLSQSTATPFGIANFGDHGIYCIDGGFISCFDSFSSGNSGAGALIGNESSGNFVRFVATGNATYGMVSSNLGMVDAGSSNCSGNGQQGAFVSTLARHVAQSATFVENGSNGVRCDSNARSDITSSLVAGSVAAGVRVFGGTVVVTSVDYTGGQDSLVNEQAPEMNGTYITGSASLLFDLTSRQATVEGICREPLSIDVDAVATIDLGTSARTFSCHLHSSSVATLQGLFRGKTVTGPSVTNIVTTGITFATAGTVLTGTTGVSGNFTVSCAGQILYLENRTVAAKSVVVHLVGVVAP